MAFPNDDTKFTSGDVAREMQLKSAKARSRNSIKRKAFRDILNEEFDKKVKVNGEDDKKISRKEAVTLKLMQILLNPTTNERDFIKALEFARDTIGEKPIERMQIEEVDQSTIDEVERIVLNDEGTSD